MKSRRNYDAEFKKDAGVLFKNRKERIRGDF